MTNLACTDVRLELVAYLDGELPEALRAQVETHLTGCAACEAERQELDGVWSALDHLPGLEARPGWLAELEGNILEQAGAEAAESVASTSATTPATGSVIKLPWALAAAAGLLMAGGVAWWAADRAADPHQPQVAPATPAPRVETPEAPIVRVPKQELVPDVEVPQDPNRFDVPPGPDAPDTPKRRQPAVAREERELQQALAKLDPVDRKVVENLQALAMLEEREDRDLIGNLDLLDDMDEDELDEG